jgi:hypothetical protein
MTTPVSNIPISVDYTSRDYYSLREALIERVSARIRTLGNREWTGDDPADFGVALIEAFAYMGDSINYYLDRVANESYLPTATQRQNVLNIAYSYGYSPDSYKSAATTIQFTNLTASPVTIPEGSQVSGEVMVNDTIIDVIFTTTAELTVAANSSGFISANHGESIGLRLENQPIDANDVAGELIGTSDGTSNQQFELSETSVIQDSVNVFVENGDVFELWERVTHLGDYGPADAVYEMIVDSDNVNYVTFGDGVSGAIPNVFAQIKANYIVGGGVIGNISTNVITNILRVPDFTDSETQLLDSKLTTTNTSTGVGGTDPESTASIRQNAPKALVTLNRAVSLVDYESLAISSEGVGKARAVANNRNSISLYIAPFRNEGTAEETPGMEDETTPTDSWITLQGDVSSALTDKTQIGVTVTVLPPSYAYAAVELSYTKSPQFTEAQIETDIKLAILSVFSYENINFNTAIRPEDVELVVRSIPGVTSARVVYLYRVGDIADRTILLGEPNEIFVFTGDAITPNIASSIATLSDGNGIVPSLGTLSPSFTSEFTTYSLVVPNGTTEVTLVATAQESGATIYIDGTVTSALGTVVTTPVGNKNVPVIVFAPDGVTNLTYNLTITRIS